MTHLITGGTGLIGSRIVRDLVRDGEQVVIYDWLPEMGALERLLSADEIRDKIKIVQGDVTDFPYLLRTMKENGVEKIIHLAGLLQVGAGANPPLAVKVNCEGTVKVFEAASFLGLKKVVWASSGSVFGPKEMYSEEYIPNDAPHYPQNIYGATKSFYEVVATHYSSQYDMDITALRYVLVYGAGQVRSSGATIMRELVYNPALGKPGRVPAPGVLGWIYVDDAARAAVLTSKAGKTKTKAFSIMGEIFSVEEVADVVRALLPDADITILPLSPAAAAAGGQTWKYDTRPIEDEIGFRLQWTVKQGIKETINIVRREHGLPDV
jgi:nucleoside-diphosphate-sugar epimerase